MKLLRLHIDNFGGLHDYDFAFEDGLNVILHDNGWGKTTMAAFLKAMLYGFDSKRSKDITENERKRYLPWQGGKYGGTLDFEADGVTYRVSRTFGETPRFDRTKILNLDAKTTARIDPEKIGETLFRLNASAFQRSVFINQNGLSIDGAASSIHTRLNALVSQANDVAAFDNAIASLTAQIKVYEKTGARGKIGEITKQITALERKRDQLEADISKQDADRNRILQIDVLLREIDKDLAEKKKSLDRVSGEAKTREASQKLLDDLKRQISALQETMDGIRAELGGRIPEPAEMDAVNKQKQSANDQAQRLDELERSYDSLTREYQALLEIYHDALPTAEQLDEIQSVYGELQGIRSSGAEETTPVGDEPEGYTRVKKAADGEPDYVGRLREAVEAQTAMQQDIHRLEALEGDLKRAQDVWEDKKRQYEDLSQEAARLQEQAEALKEYAPDAVGTTIGGLETLQEKQRTLTEQAERQDAAIREETDEWEQRKRRYSSLKEKADRLRQEFDAKSGFASENVKPAIAQLEDLQQLQQLVDVRTEELSGEGLTADQAAFLAKYPDQIPDAAEGRAVLKKLRNIAQNRSDLQGLEARRDGEQSRADGLQASIAQFDSIPDYHGEAVEEPKKSAGTAMIGIGAAAAVVGAVLALTFAPILAGAAVVGAILAIFGVVSNRGYKKKMQAYEAYKEMSDRSDERLKKKAELQAQLNAAKELAASLQTQIDALQQTMQTEQASVDAWAEQWLPGSKATEECVSKAIDDAEQAAKLREKRQGIAEKERFVQEKRAHIAAEREKMDAQFPGISARRIADALEYLRSSETDYKLSAEQMQTARDNLNKFLEESKLTAEQLDASEAPCIAEMKLERDRAKQELEEIASQRKAYEEAYPEIAGATYDDALKILRSQEGNYRVIAEKRDTALGNLNKFLEDSAFTAEQFAAETSPNVEELLDKKRTAAQALTQALNRANAVLTRLEMNADSAHIVQALRKAEQMLHEYQQYSEKLRDRAGMREKKQRQIDALQQTLEDKLPALQSRYSDREIPDRLRLIREEIDRGSRFKEKIKETEAERERQKRQLEHASRAVDAFVSTYGQFPAETEDILAEIARKATAYSETAAAKKQLENQAAETEPDEAAGGAPAEEEKLRDEITQMEARRDRLRDEYMEKNGFIRQADQSLEQYPDVLQEIRQLYEQKQSAQNALAVLKRTIQLITQAKENLANRYLSQVEHRFNNYMHAWLENDAVRGILDIDFNVTIEENEKIHVAEGYSAGYCDLIDFCMRLALVDTLFEHEQPFLILDDPFVNLDTERLDKALELLNVMAASKQLVYFVCHPIRAVDASEDSAARAEFVRLAEAARKTVENRRTSETKRAIPSRKSPKELYRVVQTGGAAAIRPEKPDYTITNNIFSLNFLPNDLGPRKDSAYELFFIDAKGRVLNDRQLIEIKDGKLSTEKVQFCLNTRDDSGDQYELMIRESGQEDYTVADRIPFRVKLAFAGTFSFDL